MTAVAGDNAAGHIAVVVIGRNEGDRLRTCLDAVRLSIISAVYVDSGSDDGSVDMAHGKGVDVVELDMSKPFTAARARNAGFARLQARCGSIKYVQFVDGDCELDSNWVGIAAGYLDTHPRVVAVCGRLRERYPERSVYNRLCDSEWNRPIGETKATGGIFMIRADAFAAVGQFRDDIVAGEEPELCSRLRQRGWVIWRLPDSMAKHDAAMFHFSQWWHRSRRGGFASALLANTPGYLDAGRRRRHNWGVLMWAVGIPALGLGGMLLESMPLTILALMAYPLQIVRLALRSRAAEVVSWEVALFTVLGKFPSALGLFQFVLSTRKRSTHVAFDHKR